MTPRNPTTNPLPVRTAFALGVGLCLGLSMGLATACAGRDEGREGGKDTPAFAAVTLAGDSVSLSDLRGQVVVLNVWATWCEPCRDEGPELEAIREEYADSGLHVVGVTVDNRGAEQQIRDFVQQLDLRYDIWWDPDGAAVDAFDAMGVPLTVLLDREGHVAWQRLGAIEADDPDLRAAIEATL